MVLAAGLVGTSCASTTPPASTPSSSATPRTAASLSDRVSAGRSPSASDRCRQFLPFIE